MATVNGGKKQPTWEDKNTNAGLQKTALPTMTPVKVEETVMTKDVSPRTIKNLKNEIRSTTVSTKFEDVPVVRETFSTVRTKLRKELRSEDEFVFQGITIDEFLSFIAAERLRRMPHRGSRWDKIVKWAEYFTSQTSIFQTAINDFTPQSAESVKIICGCCRALLQMGPGQAVALEKAFGIFYRLGLLLSFYLRNRQLFFAANDIRQGLGHALSDLLTLAVDVLSTYQRTIKSMSSGSAMTVEYSTLFGRTVDSFFANRDQIANRMWTYQLSHSSHYTEVNIGSIRSWLAPQDSVLQMLSSDRPSIGNVRAEYTCEWFDKHLSEFVRSKDSLLLVSGPSGCGKSVICGWIGERLQRPLAHKLYKSIHYSIDSGISIQATSLSLVKSFLFQMLEQSVGDIELYRSLADVFQLTAKFTDPLVIESQLWGALSKALKKCDGMIIVVDGLKEITGGEAEAKILFGRLQEIAKLDTVQVVVLSQPFATEPSKPVRKLSITPSETLNDIKHFIESSLKAIIHSRGQEHDHSAIHELTDQVAKRSEGSFLWAELVLDLLEKEKSLADMTHVVGKAPKEVSGVIEKLVSKIDLNKHDTRLILSWLLVTRRPFTEREMHDLLALDLSRTTYVHKHRDVRKIIQDNCKSLVQVQEDIVRFRHSSIRQYLLSLSQHGKHLMSSEDAHRDLSLRSLLYVKTSLNRYSSPSFDYMESQTVSGLFRKHHFLEYSVRYWVYNFQKSSAYKSGELQNIGAEFKSAFPESTLFALLEGFCWDARRETRNAIDMHVLALRIRQLTFGEEHECVLQTFINTARIYQFSTRAIEASTYYFRAAQLSRSMMGIYSAVAISCAFSYIACIETIKLTTRTEITIRKEEILKYLIMTCDHEHGSANELTLKYKTFLAQLYMDIKETHLAEAIYREIYTATVQEYGEFSVEATSASKDLTTVLVSGNKREDVAQYTRGIFEVAERSMEVIDVRRITTTIHLAEVYERLGDLVMAEEIYITLWRRLCEYCHKKSTASSHERKLEVTLHYVRFLRRHHRVTEVETILCGVWAEYEHTEFKSESFVLQIKVIGEELKQIGLLEVAISIFTSVWGFFKKTGKQTTVEAVSIAILLIETTQACHTHSETVTYAQSILMEVFESITTTTTTTTEITVTTVKTCETLSEYYIREERWSESLKICEKLLHSIWSSLVTGHGTCSLPKAHASEAVRSAIRLAYCHFKERRVEKAESIYVQIFKSAKESLHIQDELVTETVHELINFYKSTEQYIKIIEVQKQLLESYRSTLSSTHTLTIKTLYALGSLCLEHKQKNVAIKYYWEVVTNLSDDSVCHHGAMDAALILSRFYYEESNWTEARKICSILWATIKVRTEQYKLSSETIKTIYQRYTTILEKHIQVEYTVLRQITIEYRETCINAFGVDSEIAIAAAIQLAEICQKHTKYQQEAIEIYEEIIKITEKTTKTSTTVSLRTKVTQKLAHLYTTVTTTSTTTTTRAVTLYVEHFELIKSQHSCSHESTLSSFRELMLFYKKQNTEHYNSLVLREMRSFTVEIITKEQHSKKLFDAGCSIATTFVSCKLAEKGWELLRELRRQITSKDAKFVQQCGFDIRQHVDRRSLVFIVAFEETLRGSKTVVFSDIMADLLTESILYEHYHVAIQGNTTIETKMLCGAHLRGFLITKQRKEQCLIVEDELLEIFIKAKASGIKSTGSTRLFFLVLLDEISKSVKIANFDITACNAGNSKVLDLVKTSHFQEALGLATYVFHYAKLHHCYRQANTIGYGFKLSLYMALRGFHKSAEQKPDQKVHTQMIDLSKTILRETLDGCKNLKINFVQMQESELNDLAGLMGEQKNFGDLEWLLAQLWHSRQLQSSWSEDTVIQIGRRLVEVRYVLKRTDAAIHLCEDICYNLRRVRGLRDASTNRMFALLRRLYNSEGRYKDAMNISKEILRVQIDGEDDEEMVHHEDKGNVASSILLPEVKHIQCNFQRQGGWDDADEWDFKDLISRAMKDFNEKNTWKDVTPVDKWNPKSGQADKGFECFLPPTSWGISGEEKGAHRHILNRTVSSGWDKTVLQSKIANGTNGDVYSGSGLLEADGEGESFVDASDGRFQVSESAKVH